ncbi:reverse transcriptase domain-containing protein, partial [Tanacetum coccineum]
TKASDKAIPGENKRSSQRLPQLFHRACSARSEQKSRCSKQTGFDDLLKTGQRSFGGSPARKVNCQKEVADIIKEEGPIHAKSIIQEIHQGSCGMHAGSQSVVSKIMKLGYYWPSMHNDAKALIQILSMAPRGARFLVIAIDYFTKWVKVKPLVSTTGKHMKKFVWDHIVCTFGIPQIIISDNGKQFAKGIFPVFCQKLGILQCFTSAYHPQANGQFEVTNRDIVKGMKLRLGKTHQGWMDELPHVIWAHRTTTKSNNGETPFSLVYSSKVVVPIEISVETKRIKEFEVRQNKKRLREDLDILKEPREIASIIEAYY